VVGELIVKRRERKEGRREGKGKGEKRREEGTVCLSVP
jgi:hypothetical protein